MRIVLDAGTLAIEDLMPCTSYNLTVMKNLETLHSETFRTVEGKNQSGGEDSLSSLTISDTLSKTGVNVNYQKEPALSKCKENQIYLMDKQKMFLVSSEKIVHDISGWINMMILGL